MDLSLYILFLVIPTIDLIILTRETPYNHLYVCMCVFMCETVSMYKCVFIALCQVCIFLLSGSEGIIQDVCLLGAPVPYKKEVWDLFPRIVAGKIYNGYCR